jgi:hypothetical protein
VYIRWIVRGHKNSDVADVTFHDAYLVESYRDENGSPRQRTVSYLGNIRQIGDEFPGIERELFLLRAEIILESLPELSPLDREDTLKQLHEKVPPMDAAEMMIGFKNTLRWYFKWWRENGGEPNNLELHHMIEKARRTEKRPRVDKWG